VKTLLAAWGKIQKRRGTWGGNGETPPGWNLRENFGERKVTEAVGEI